MSNVYKVTEIKENEYSIDCNRLINALVLKYINPIISIPFVAKTDTGCLDELCKRTKVDCKDGKFYDIDGNLITRDMMIGLISSDLCSSAKLFLESKEDKVYQANMVKSIFETKVLSKLHQKNDSSVLTVDDLMAKLYNVSEEKGSMSK